ncbi:oligoribonuclease [Neiella marina]|uniref:Oligoribonuclease n=1 Tax=Neiella marina TaxID=508461 RepID=A0A8J2U832_9GAMM|nr:oligoribonuclease [Neiella marina]GGA85666.1 oligoribonuclease [Neiella marina]
MAKDKHLIWIDLEMTGLEPMTDVIIEIATIVTDDELNVIAEGPVIAIHQSDTVLAGMDEWCTRTHTESGLVARIKESEYSVQQAEAETLAFLSDYVEKGASPMCGNSIGQDRRFIYKYMPDLAEFFHYRNIDVSTLKELARRWRPDLAPFAKQNTHLAMDDIRESIAELMYYREHFLRS